MFRPNFAAQESLLPSNGHAIIANLHEYRNSDSPFRTTFARNASAETPLRLVFSRSGRMRAMAEFTRPIRRADYSVSFPSRTWPSQRSKAARYSSQ